LIPKAATAYAGTYVVGLSLQRHHRTGYGLSLEERKNAYEDALRSGRSVAERLAAGFHRVDAA